MANEVCSVCRKLRVDVKQLIALPNGHICNECVALAADLCGITDEGRKAKSAARADVQDAKLPQTTKEFAQWLRAFAEQVDRIPDRPVHFLDEGAEIGLFYGNPMFPQMPTGLHFEVKFATTEFLDLSRRA